MAAVTDRMLSTWQNRVTTSVRSAGAGDPIVYFHGEAGLQWDPVLDALAEHSTVHAPLHPGTDVTHAEDIRAIDSLWELVLYYAEVLDGLGVRCAPVIGHSFGGMVAAEFAATYPERVSRLVLINPLGLWRNEQPVANWMALDPRALARATYFDPYGPLASAVTSVLENAGDQPDAAARYLWAHACAGKFTWPIPDRGLSRRIHRIIAPTLIIWGRHDGIVPVEYAGEFQSRIRNASVAIVEQAAHVPQQEQPQAVAAHITEFLRQRGAH